MTWWAYVQRHAEGENNSVIARKVGLTPSSVGRWAKDTRPDPIPAAAFARAYGRPVLEAFVAAGFLTPEEAKQRPSAAPSLASLTDDDLLNEVRRRMAGGSDAGTTREKSPRPRESGTVHHLRAARTLKGDPAGKREREWSQLGEESQHRDGLGEESQDDGGTEPS